MKLFFFFEGFPNVEKQQIDNAKVCHKKKQFIWDIVLSFITPYPPLA